MSSFRAIKTPPERGQIFEDKNPFVFEKKHIIRLKFTHNNKRELHENSSFTHSHYIFYVWLLWP
ncbi:hypothetical protein AH248_23735 [Salmonella enterica subsp. enterica]|nr:hypothetical protein [Salmonella enterica subsp. enterica]